MEFKFIAVNGDNVGDSIGNAIATDNHEELANITGGLKNAHAAIEEWVASVGGETVTSSGDEGIYKVPADSFDEAAIENLRTQYSDNAGTTLTIGIGGSMSEASKALIYGKLNDKDQVVEYDPHIDDYIASHDEEAEMVMPEDGMPEDSELEETGDEVADRDTGEADAQYQEEVPEGEETAVAGEAPNEETDEVPMDEAMDPEAMAAQAEGEETVAEEGEMSEDDLDVDPEAKLDEVIGEDLDGDGDIDAMPASDDPLAAEGEEVPEHEAHLSPEEKEMHDSTELMSDDQEIAQEEAAAQAMGAEGDIPPEMQEEMPEEGMEADNHDAISDMIHSNMGEEEGSSPAEDEASEEEIRQDIIASLQTFKENKPMLEQAKTQNPKLYEATILMLRSMIEMAKMRGMSPMEDAEAMEAQDAMPDADMVEPAEGEEAPAQEAEEAPEANEEEEKEDEENEKDFKDNFKKNEMTKLYGDLMKAAKVLEKASKKK